MPLPTPLTMPPLRALLLAFGLLASTLHEVEAQGFDLRSIIPGNNPRDRIAAERLQRDLAQRQNCDRLKGWLEEAPLGIAPGRQTGADQNTAALALLEDGRFARAFGKTYDQMTTEELTALTRDAVPRCLSAQGPLANYNEQRGVVYTALSPQRQAANIKQIQAARGASASLQAITEELRTLQPNEQGYARLNAIHQSGDASVKTADRKSAAAYADALAAADAQVAAPMQTALVQDAIAHAQGYDGLVQLARVAADIGKRGPASTVTRQNQHQLSVRIEQIASELVAVERQRIDVLGNGMVGLERGVEWQREFESRYRPYATQAPKLGEMQAYFATRREALFGTTANEFAALARRATTDEQLGALQRRYLLVSDSSSVAGTQMLSTLAAQRYELEKRSALGSGLDQERRETAASTGAAPKGSGQGGAGPRPSTAALAPNGGNGGSSGNNNANSGASGGEPTQEVMYDLVRTRYENEAERIRNLSKRCGSNRMSDAGDAIVCLSVAMAGGVGADQPPKITRFEKLGCAVANGKPGYYCEFTHSVSGGPTKFMGPITQSLAGDGGVSNARFLKRGGDWIMITSQDR